MHIALVSEHQSPLVDPGEYGAEGGDGGNRVADLAASLVALGASVEVFTRKDSAALDDEVLTPAGFRVINVTAGPARRLPEAELLPYTSDFGSALRDRWVRRRPDVVHAHCWMSGLAGELAAHEVGVPTVMSFHGCIATTDGQLGQAAARRAPVDAAASAKTTLQRKVGRSADRIIAFSSDEADRLTRTAIARAKISVVPGGVAVDHFDANGPRAERNSSKFRLVTGGDLSPQSGVDAVVDVLRGIPRAELLVVGGGPDIQRLYRAASDRGVTDRVVFAGAVPRSEMPAILRSADLFVCTSPSESAAVAALEAMACGVPVVARAVGAVTDVVVDGITGRLVDGRSNKTLARAVEYLVRDEPRRFALGVAGADRAQSRFSWERIADNTVRVYEDAVNAAQAKLDRASRSVMAGRLAAR